MLTGYDIDVYREVEEEDVDLNRCKDEIDAWIIDALKAVGCDTASVWNFRSRRSLRAPIWKWSRPRKWWRFSKPNSNNETKKENRQYGK